MAARLQVRHVRVRTARGWQEPHDLDAPVVAVLGPADTGKSMLLDSVAFAMGRDRNFPSFFSRVHAQKNTPHWAIFLSLLIVVFMAVSLPIEVVATAADVMFLLIFLQVNLALITLRKKRQDLDRGFWVPLFPWISILGIICNLALALFMFTYSLRAWAVTAVWIVAGLLIF